MKAKIHGSTEPLYWIAINGASCSRCGFPPFRAKQLDVSPVPEQLLGFPTRAEQVEAQRICLHESIAKVKAWQRSLRVRIDDGEIGLIVPSEPEPPNYEAGTAWTIMTL